MKKNTVLISIAAASAILVAVMIIANIQYKPDPAGWDCSGGDPTVGVCAPVNNTGQQIALLVLDVVVFGAVALLIQKKFGKKKK